MKKLTCLPVGKILPHFYILLPISILTLIFIFLPIQNVAAQSGRNCLEEYQKGRGECTDAHKVCVDACPGAQGVDLSALGSCLKLCDRQQGLCNDAAKGAYDACIALEQNKNQEKGKVITCDQVWEIVGSEECDKWVVSNDEGGVWCNLPETRESLQPWIYGPAPAYTFTPGTCSVESGSESGRESSREASKQQRKPSQDGNPLNIFDINPFETWLNLNAFAEAGAFINSGIAERFAESTVLHMTGKEPIWEKEAREVGEAKKFFDEATSRLAELESKGGEADSSLTSARARVETTKFNLLLKGGGALIELQPMDGQNGVLEKGQPPILKSGAVDVIVEPQDGQQFEIQTPNTEILVIGTEFSIIYDQKRRQTLMAVYKGKVEVKSKDGKTTEVFPKGDKPGIVVVSQKLSAVKLGIAGVVLAAILGGLIMILRRKFVSKGFSKKKK